MTNKSYYDLLEIQRYRKHTTRPENMPDYIEPFTPVEFLKKPFILFEYTQRSCWTSMFAMDEYFKKTYTIGIDADEYTILKNYFREWIDNAKLVGFENADGTVSIYKNKLKPSKGVFENVKLFEKLIRNYGSVV